MSSSIVKKSDDRLDVTCYRGIGSFLFAMDLDRSRTSNLAGFSIHCIAPNKGPFASNKEYPPITYSGPDSRAVVVTGHCIDNAGNTGTGTFKFNYESTPPDTTISAAVDGDNAPIPINGPTGSTVSNKITVTFAGSDNFGVAGFQCSLDDSAFSSTNCASPTTTLTNLASGTHNFKVRAVDLAGNVDPTPASFSWKILTPAEAVQSLIDAIRGMNVPNNIKTGFISPLQQALRILNDNNPANDKGVCDNLDTLLRRVNANLLEADIKITKSQADIIIHLTTVIKNRLDCTPLLPPDSESPEIPERSEHFISTFI